MDNYGQIYNLDKFFSNLSRPDPQESSRLILMSTLTFWKWCYHSTFYPTLLHIPEGVPIPSVSPVTGSWKIITNGSLSLVKNPTFIGRETDFLPDGISPKTPLWLITMVFISNPKKTTHLHLVTIKSTWTGPTLKAHLTSTYPWNA